MRQFKASEAWTAISTARRFKTGSATGSPRQVGQTLELGSAPKLVGQPQKILLRVASWTCTSRPMTGSYLVITSAERVPADMLHYRAECVSACALFRRRSAP